MQQHGLSQTQTNPATQQTAAEQQPDEGFWERTFYDPVALFTLVLAVATVGLWTFTALLWRATVSLAKDARQTSIDQADKMERSIEAANKASVAATDQVKIAEEGTYRQLRAYLSVSVEILRANPKLLKGRLTITNTGQTPAKIDVYAATWLGPQLGGRGPEMPEPRADTQLSPYVNARSTEGLDWFHPYLEFGSAEAVEAWIEKPGGRVLYYYGRVEFTDYANQQRRILNFCHRSHGPPVVGKQLPMIALPWGNGYEKRDLNG